MHKFTPEDLIQYLYHETSPSKSAEIKAALENDWTLREKMDVLVSAKQKLEPVSLSPRTETINNILEHAERALEAVASQA